MLVEDFGKVVRVIFLGFRIGPGASKTPKPKLLGFLQADLDQDSSEGSSSDSLRFYQVFTNIIEGPYMENLRRQHGNT